MKKRNMIIGMAVVCVAAATIAAMAFFATNKAQAMNEKKLIVQSNLEMSEVNIIGQVAGRIVELNFKEGDIVKEGQVIAKIDSDTLLAQKHRALAQIETINSQIASAEASQKGSSAKLNSVRKGKREEEIAQEQAAYDLVKANYDRMNILYADGAVSKAELDELATKLEIATQKLAIAKNQATAEDIASAEANVEAAQASVETLYGQLKQAQAGLEEIETYLKKTVITAPASGVLTQLNAERGELISSGFVLAVVTDTSSPWIQCNIMEDELSKVKLHQEVSIELGAYPDLKFKGEVIAINKSADFAVKRATNANGEFDILSYGVKVRPIDVKKPIFAGMTAFVDFDARKEGK